MSNTTCHDCGHVASEDTETLQRDYGWEYVMEHDCWLCRSCGIEREEQSNAM